MGLVGEFGAAVREVKRREGERDFFLFFGERFDVVDEVGVMPLMEFAAAADSGLDSADMRGLAAMHAMIRDCLDTDARCAHCAAVVVVAEPDTDDKPTCTEECGKAVPRPSDWDRFRQVAKDRKASPDVLLEVCGRLYEVISTRPTESPSGSSDGRPPTATSPSSSSSSTRRAALDLVPVDDLTQRDANALRAG